MTLEPGEDAGGAVLDDHSLAADIATETGRRLLALRAAMEDRRADRWSVRDAGDMSAHHYIIDRLRAARPDDAILSEEGHDDPARTGAERVWIVDPLDGTREFGEPGRSDWAVHVALVVDEVAIVGAVALPAHDLTLCTSPAPPTPAATPPGADGRGRPRFVVSRSRAPHVAVFLAHHLDADLLPLGSAGAKAMAVVLGEADAYIHAGGQYEWDSAAPVAVAAAAGLHTSRLDGSPLRYNQLDPWLPDLLICQPALADPIHSLLMGG